MTLDYNNYLLHIVIVKNKWVSMYKVLRIVLGTLKCIRNISHCYSYWGIYSVPLNNGVPWGQASDFTNFLIFYSKSPFPPVPYSKLAFSIYVAVSNILLEQCIKWLNSNFSLIHSTFETFLLFSAVVSL